MIATVDKENSMSSTISMTIWDHKRTRWTLFWFWLVSMGGAGLLQRASLSNLEPTWVMMCALVLTIGCLPHGRWRLRNKIMFPMAAWFGISVLGAVAMVIVLPISAATDRLHLMPRIGNFIASIPFIWIAMRQSPHYTKMMSVVTAEEPAPELASVP